MLTVACSSTPSRNNTMRQLHTSYQAEAASSSMHRPSSTFSMCMSQPVATLQLKKIVFTSSIVGWSNLKVGCEDAAVSLPRNCILLEVRSGFSGIAVAALHCIGHRAAMPHLPKFESQDGPDTGGVEAPWSVNSASGPCEDMGFRLGRGKFPTNKKHTHTHTRLNAKALGCRLA